MLVFCHEFLSDRWSYRPTSTTSATWASTSSPSTSATTARASPSPATPRCIGPPTARSWTSARRCAYLRSRPDRDPAGFGLFGVSRGGTTALLVAADERDVWGVITDGAFPTIGTMMAYILRWAELYLRTPLLRGMVPPLALPRAGPVRPPAIGAAAALPVPRRRAGRGATGTAALAHDPRRSGHLHQPRDRPGALPLGRRPEGALAGPGRQAQPLPRARARGLRRPALDFLDRYAPRRPITEAPAPSPVPVVASATEDDVELSTAFDAEIEAPKLTSEVAAPLR